MRSSRISSEKQEWDRDTVLIQFSPDFWQTNPAATRCYLVGKPKDPKPAPPEMGS